LLRAFSSDVGCVVIGKRGLLATVSDRCVITAFRATATAFTATFTTAFAWLTGFACFTGLALFATGFGCGHFTACSGGHGGLIGQGQFFLGCVAGCAGALSATLTTVCALSAFWTFAAWALTTAFAARLTFAAGLSFSAQVWASFAGAFRTATIFTTAFAATFYTAFGGSAFWTTLGAAFRAAFTTRFGAAFAALSTALTRPLRAAFGAFAATTTTAAARIAATTFAAL
jgi:hypothetical protein